MITNGLAAHGAKVYIHNLSSDRGTREGLFLKNGAKVITEKEGRLDILGTLRSVGIVAPLDTPNFLPKSTNTLLRVGCRTN